MIKTNTTKTNTTIKTGTSRDKLLLGVLVLVALAAVLAVPGSALARWPESLAGVSPGAAPASWGWLLLGAPLAALLTGGCFRLRSSNARLRDALAEVTHERDRLEEKSRRNEMALEQANAESEALITLLRREKTVLEECTKTVSHDLRGPLTAVKGFAKLLVKDVRKGNEERITDDIDQILVAADKMTEMLDHLKRVRRGELTWTDVSALPLRAAVATESTHLAA